MATVTEVLEGLKVLEKYSKKHRVPAFVYGSHDLVSVDRIAKREVTDADVAELERHGWHWDDEVEAWARFT